MTLISSDHVLVFLLRDLSDSLLACKPLTEHPRPDGHDLTLTDHLTHCQQSSAWLHILNELLNQQSSTPVRLNDRDRFAPVIDVYMPVSSCDRASLDLKRCASPVIRLDANRDEIRLRI